MLYSSLGKPILMLDVTAHFDGTSYSQSLLARNVGVSMYDFKTDELLSLICEGFAWVVKEPSTLSNFNVGDLVYSDNNGYVNLHTTNRHRRGVAIKQTRDMVLVWLQQNIN